MAKLLIIEDDASIRRFLERVAGPLGHECIAAGDGAEGLRLAADEEVRLILCDLQLPGEPTGMDLVRSLREQRPLCPILVVSGYPTAERLDECNRLGISDFLTKPYEMSFVREAITRALAAGA